MTNGNNAAQGKHLESLATATKRYILAQILDVTDAVSSELENASGSGVLDTVPATVNGGMWYELNSGVPRYVKLKHGDHTLSLTPSIVSISPNLTVTPAATLVPGNGSITATVSYLGTGTITVSGSDGVTPTYNASTKVVTVPYNVNTHTATITVSLGASYGYLAETATFNVTMDNVSPNLTVTHLNYGETPEYPGHYSVSYLGDGTISVATDNENIQPTYDSSTKIITTPFYYPGDAYNVEFNIIVTVSPSGNYSGQTVTHKTSQGCGTAARIWNVGRITDSVFYPPADHNTVNYGWQTYTGTPSFTSRGTVVFDGETILYKPDFPLGGQDFVLKFWAKYEYDVTERTRAKSFYWNGLEISNNYNMFQFQYGSKSRSLGSPNGITNYEYGEWIYHCAIYLHAEQTLTLYINGKQGMQLTDVSIPRTSATLYLGGYDLNYDHYRFKGSIDDLKLVEAPRAWWELEGFDQYIDGYYYTNTKPTD